MNDARLQKIRRMAQGRLSGLRLVIEDVHDPHNAAAIMRTCDALGVQDVWFVFVQEKPYNPRRVGKSSSSSANKWLSFHTYKSVAECVAALKAEGYTSLGTVLKDADASTEGYDFLQHEKIALWFGNEHRGLSGEALAHMDVRMMMPMRGMVESLNVSVAAALFLSTIAEKWRASGRTLDTGAVEALVEELRAR
ncbi:MAG: RNA methyltransferase [Candidatus Pacebacteria bacterium]|nr:RNA methyltransferase [Candidatus Paceibacterota bacterium]